MGAPVARTVLVAGGAGSGKSAYAEALLCSLAPEGAERIYLATMRPFGAEAAERIARHRAQRSGRGFRTVERPLDIASAELPRGCAALVEDIGNLCANELFDPAGAGRDAADAVVSGIGRLRERCSLVVLVTNEAGSGGADWLGDTLRWLRVLGEVNCRLAACADEVYEVAYGIAIRYK